MNGTGWTWPGARWWRCDLHTHTPGSHDFVDRDTVSAADWVEAAKAAGLQVVAITDHNTNAWVDEVRDPGLNVFPGLELTVTPGVHLLAILDPSRGANAVGALLGRCGVPDWKWGDPEALSPCSVEEVLKAVADAGGLCIAAHADDENGILKIIPNGQSLMGIVTSTHLSAVEVKNDDPDLLCWVDGSKPEYRRSAGPLAFLHGSDAHALDQLGRRSTWLKMTTPTLEGLRLALQDGDLSVCREPDDPNQHATAAIEAITIDKGRYVGRRAAFELRLNPWLNAIIGGRGTGKSTVVELLRAALRRESELPRRLSDNWREMVRVPRTRGERGILTDQSHVSVIYRKDGARFRIQWKPDGSAPPIEVEQPDGSWAASAGHVADRFPVRIYSQKQVFELTEDPESLLRIVDEAPEVEFRAWQEAWTAEEGRFLSLRAQAREVAASLADEARVRGDLEDVQRQLAVFEKAGHAELLRRWQLRRRQQRAVDDWAQGLGETASHVVELAGSISLEAVDSSAFDAADAADAALLTSITEVEAQVVKLREEALTLATRMNALRDAWPGNLASSPWQAALDEANAAYARLIEELQAAGGRDPSQYGQLVQRRQLLEKQLGTFEGKRKTVKSLRKQARASLERLENLRRELSTRRSDFLSTVLADNPFVRIDVVPMGITEGFTAELRRLLGREDSAFQKDIGEPGETGTLVGDFTATYQRDLQRAEGEQRSAMVDEHYARLAELKRRIRAIRGGKRTAADQRFANFLSGRPPEQMDRLDAWFPADTLQVSFQGRGRRGFQPISQGSPGQRSAALLAFLLSHGSEPIVLDQPEDDLDNQLVYDLIVQQIRRIKGRRQVLVVTHNANIVVNGDAEYVVALNVPAGEVLVEQAGGLQEQAVRDEICRVMEGGAEAFRERFRRIAAGAGDV